MRKLLSFPAMAVLMLLLSACVSTHAKPCSLGGQPARAGPLTFVIGRKSCDQIADDAGNPLNHGKYYEWYLNDQIAIVGEYNKGKKSGRWLEYDENGKITFQGDFEDGKEKLAGYGLKAPHDGIRVRDPLLTPSSSP